MRSHMYASVHKDTFPAVYISGEEDLCGLVKGLLEDV